MGHAKTELQELKENIWKETSFISRQQLRRVSRYIFQDVRPA
jgi:hypothetical protein